MCAIRGVGVAVVELGDRALAEERAELAKAARPLGNGHGEDRLALLAQLGTLGDEAQAVEVHVGAAGDRDQVRLFAVPLGPRLDAGDGERAGGLEDRARVLEHVLDRGADGVGVDQDDVVDAAAAQSRNVSLPTCFTATPSANRPTCASVTRRPAASERAIASESTGCTPMILISGRRRFT